jgi:hypothetical protein
VLDAYALGILLTLDDPRLAILAALARVPEASTVDFSRDPDFDWRNPEERGVRINWPWLVLQEAVRVLRQQGS